MTTFQPHAMDPAAVSPPPADAEGARPAPGRLRRLFLGGPDDPRWARPGLWGVLALAAVLYAWNLGALGDANSFYAAAIYSGTQSWKAFFFGSIDAGSYITVDKPPFALWVMGLSARVFGYSTWSMLLPQAAAGVAAIGVLYATVRRAFTNFLGTAGASAAGLIAGLVLALTPITVAINRDNNPDTILVLLLVLAFWAATRALEQGRLRWLVASAVFVGFAFNTKMLQAYLVVPALGLAYLLFAGTGLWRRIWHLLVAGVALVVSSGWWMWIVDAIPAGSRPYIGGSTNNTVWDLVMGYNGLGRIFGQNHGASGVTAGQVGSLFGLGSSSSSGGGPGGGGGGGGGAGFGGSSGAGRMFNDIVGGQISWLLPFAAIALVVGLLLTLRRPRADAARAGLVLWGGWLAVHWVIFSFSEGTFHPYYTTTLAPAIGALVGVGGVAMFRASRRWAWALPLALVVTAAWAFTLLRRNPSWHPWVAWTVLALTAAALVAFAAVRLFPGRVRRTSAGIAVVTALALGAGLLGPAAYAVSPLSGSGGMGGTNPLAGPSTGGFGGGPGGRGGFPGGGRQGGPMGTPPGGLGGQNGQFPGAPGQNGSAQGGSTAGQNGSAATGQGQNGPGGGMRGGMGGDVSTAMMNYLVKNQGGATWLVAVSSAQGAAPIILKTGKPVIAMGGFTGSDPAMTVAKLQQYVKEGKLTYVMTGGGMGGPNSGGSSVTSWVQKNCAQVKASEYGETSSSSSSLYRCTA